MYSRCEVMYEGMKWVYSTLRYSEYTVDVCLVYSGCTVDIGRGNSFSGSPEI